MNLSRPLAEISELLPESFSFYDQGLVRLTNDPSSPLDLNACRGVGFRIYHLEDAPSLLLVFIFESTLDESMYTEMGNILASKLCDNLSAKDHEEMMISPPIVLKCAQLKRLSSQSLIRRPYQHSTVLNGVQQSIPIETWTLSGGQSEVVYV